MRPESGSAEKKSAAAPFKPLEISVKDSDQEEGLWLLAEPGLRHR
jgi:hypothetical protein